MKNEATAIQRNLRLSGILLILGFIVEFISLLWEKPLAFILFAFVGGILFLGGIVIYLYSLVSEAQRT